MLPIPEQLRPLIKDEQVYFVVEAARKMPKKKSQMFTVIGSMFIAFATFFLLVVVLMQGIGNVSTTSRARVFGILVSKSINSDTNVLLYVVPAIFALLGLAIILWNRKIAAQKGGIFVATTTKLYNLNNGKINAHKWKKFSNKTELDEKNSDITLQLKTGDWVRGANVKSFYGRKRNIGGKSSEEYIPDEFYISGVADAAKIFAICNERIETQHKENLTQP